MGSANIDVINTSLFEFGYLPQTWKDWFFYLALDSWPSEKIVFPSDVNRIGRFSWLNDSAQKLKDICFLATDFTYNNSIAYASPSIKTIRMPYVQTLTYPPIFQNGQVDDLYVPKVKSFNNNSFYGQSRRIDVHIAESTCAELMASSGFPGYTQDSVYPYIVFHCSDGSIYWDGSSWVSSPSDRESPYPYDRDKIPTFTDDPNDAYWKTLFLNITSDTWSSSSITFPAEVDCIKRNFLLASSTLKDITFLCQSNDFAPNSVYCGNDAIVRMPNVTYFSTGRSIAYSCNFKEIHLPKVKAFSNRNTTFMPNSSRFDVYIEESTCEEIMQFQNFPGCAMSTANMAKVVFHGSNGTLSYNGNEWIKS